MATVVNPERVSRRGDFGDVLQQPVRRPQFCRRAVPCGESFDWRFVDYRLRVRDGFLAILHLHAGALRLLRADDFHHEFGGVRQHEGRPRGVRDCADGRDDRLDRRRLATGLPACGLGESGSRSTEGLGRLAWSCVRFAAGRPRDAKRVVVDVCGGGRRVASARRFQPHAAAYAAEAGERQRGFVGVAEVDEAAQASVRGRALARDAGRLVCSQLLLQLDGPLLANGWHPRQLGHSGDEHRADRGNPDDGCARVLPEGAWLADHLDHRRPRPCRAVRRFRVLRFGRLQAADHHCASVARHLLRVLLRNGVHLRRRILPEGHSNERPRPVQFDDSRCRRALGRFHLPAAV